MNRNDPKYLQPIDSEGNFPWQDDKASGSKSASSSGSTSRIGDTAGSSSSSLSKNPKAKAEKPAEDLQPTVSPAQRVSKRKAA